MRTETVTGALNHIRRVHFWIVTVSVALLYVTMAVWSDLPDVLKELEGLKTSIAKIHSGTLPGLWAAKRSNRLLTTLESELGVNFGLGTRRSNHLEVLADFDRRYFLAGYVQNPAQFWPSPKAPLTKWREAFAIEARRELPAVKKIRFTPETQTWVHENNYYKPGIVVSTATVNIIGIELKTQDFKSGNAEVELKFKAIFSTWSKGEPSTVQPPPQTKTSNAFIEISQEPLASPSWFEEVHRHLMRRWHKVKRYSAEVIMESLKSEQKRKAGERGQALATFFGIPITGFEIGLPAILLFVIEVYMTIHLMHIRSQIPASDNIEAVTKGHHISPWIGTMPEAIPVAATLLSLGLLPAGALFFVCFQVFLIDIWLAIFAAVPSLVLGLYCCALARRITQNWHSTDDR